MKLYLSAALLAAALTASAAAKKNVPLVYETCELKDGTVLNGYVFTPLSDNRLVFNTENAIRIMEPDSVDNRFIGEPKVVSLNDFNGTWLEFKLRYPRVCQELFPMEGARLTMRSTDINDPDGPNVVVLPPSDNGKFRYLTIRGRQDTVAYDQIKAIRRAFIGPEQKVGILDYYVLNDGSRLEGTTTREVPGNTLTVTGRDGLFRTIAEEDFTSKGAIRIDTTLAYSTQSPFISVFRFNDGTSVKGVVLNIDYGSNTMTMERLGGSDPVTRSLDDYKDRSTYRNENYPPIPPKPLDYSQGQVYANKILLAPVEDAVRNDQVKLYPDDMAKLTTVSPDKDNTSLQITFEDAGLGNIFLTPLLPSPQRKTERDPVFNMKCSTMMASGQTPRARSVKDNGVSVAIFDMPAPGDYVLFFGNGTSVYLLKIGQMW